jgi:hypothetical protein
MAFSHALDGRGMSRSVGEFSKRRFEIGLKVQKLLKADQFDGLDNAGVADHKKLGLGVVAVLGELHQGPETGGIDEVDATQIDDHRQIEAFAVVSDEIPELLVGVGVELAGEAEQQTTFLRFATSAQGDS